MIVVTDETCLNYRSRGHPERPERVSGTLEKLRKQTELTITWDKPAAVEETILLLAHSPAHVANVKNPNGDFDPDTAAHPDIFDHAKRSVGAAMKSLEHAKNGKASFALMRPPGHHAETDRVMGFCYLNQVAIAALHAQKIGFEKVAIYDFDVHHGNGTEQILLKKPNTAFYSIHQFPCYPGTGAEPIANCKNYPVQPGVTREVYREALQRGLDDLAKWKPDLIGISAGFDAYRGDPLSEEPLEAEDFFWIGESIRKLGIPAYAVLEGGYSPDLPELIFAFLKGLSS
jgi:acetoin utilization deacetylase AcuC-like enzyme